MLVIYIDQKVLRLLKGSMSIGHDINVCHRMSVYYQIPVVPHKAVAEVSKIGNL